MIKFAIRSSLILLSPRDRLRLLLVTTIQVGTSLLDLLGILLVGLVSGLAVANLAHSQPPNYILNLISLLGLDELSQNQLIIALASAAAAFLILKSLINVVLTRRVLRFLSNRQSEIAGILTYRLLHSSLADISQRSSQETAYAITSGANFATLYVIGQGVIAISEASLLLVLTIGLLFISPIVTMFTIVFFGIAALFLHRLLGTWAGRLGRRAADADIESIESIQESFRAFRELTVLGRREFYVNHIQNLRRESAFIQSDLQFVALVPKYVFESILVIGAGLLAFTQFASQDVSAAVSVIAIFLMAGTRIVPSLLRLQSAIFMISSAAQQAVPTYNLWNELAATTRTDLETGFEVPIAQIENANYAITCENLSFSYGNDQLLAVDSISFKLVHGSSLAIVGVSGSGKSTLADLLLGLLSPNSGRSQLYGFDPAIYVAHRPGDISYVPQDVSMINDSIRHNISIGITDVEIDDDKINQALQRAHLSDFISSLPEGLETLVGENGVRLSGGQRQRLGLARALYSNPKILFLDEATSALDAETEQAITLALDELKGEVTTVTIAHRLATVRKSDLVLYLENGRCTAQGSFLQVRAISPAFDSQARLLGL